MGKKLLIKTIWVIYNSGDWDVTSGGGSDLSTSRLCWWMVKTWR